MTLDPPPAVATAPEIDRQRVLRLIEEQRKLLAEGTPRSGEYYERARRVMPNGVPSSFQENDPWPVYIERGAGAQVWDVDGNEYIDFHNGFGVMCVGHANPVIAEAVKRRVEQGTHFAAPTEGSIVVAEEWTLSLAHTDEHVRGYLHAFETFARSLNG
jgi:glutamate-1-semialdehyde 2,1-aminomutase